jgi:hypothetical protein
MSDTSAPTLNAAISLRATTATSKWLNATCPKCQKPIAEGEQAVLCPKCYTPQHAQCWRDNGNQCAIDQTPARIIERPGRAGGTAAAPAPAAAATPAPTPAAAAAPAPRAAAPAARAPSAAAAPAAAAAVPAEPVDPYKYAVPVNATPTSDLWRRNIMTVVWIVVLWAIVMLLAWIFGFIPT